MKKKELLDKSDISGLIDNADINKKIATLTTKEILDSEKDDIVKLKAFDSSYLCGKSLVKDAGAQNCLVL